MSFTAEVKDELSRIKMDEPYVARAELAALIRVCGTLIVEGNQSYRLEVSTETGAVARVFIKLVHTNYDLKTELTVRRSLLHHSHNYLIALPKQPELKESLEELGVLQDDGRIYEGIKPSLVEAPDSAAAYLRGAFLGGGFIADPKGDFHFEMTFQHKKLASDIVELLKTYSIEAKLAKRRNEYTVYIKSIHEMLDFLALVGAHQSALKIENIRVIKALRGDVNRQVNAEIANQARASQAAMAQLDMIKLIDERLGIDELPLALRNLARLRLSHPELSLRELGEMADPPLSKSAVYHRIRRLEEIAKNL
ncbi:MAG: DNA-binding protein WhiA [Coriobacteriia bacterium]|nr:DNA-binding protein WhiA [Coriobacteriia bacterium]